MKMRCNCFMQTFVDWGQLSPHQVQTLMIKGNLPPIRGKHSGSRVTHPDFNKISSPAATGRCKSHDTQFVNESIWKIPVQPRTMQESWHRIREWFKLTNASPAATRQILVDKSQNTEFVNEARLSNFQSSRLMLHPWISRKWHEMGKSNPNNLFDHFSMSALSKFTAQENEPVDNWCNSQREFKFVKVKQFEIDLLFEQETKSWKQDNDDFLKQ